MKISVIGAPSTGKSVFTKRLTAEMGQQGLSCELVQEYASTYIQQAGAPAHAWEQLTISVGQYLAEQHTTRDFMVTDAAAFVTYIYARRLLPSKISDQEWPKYQHLLDLLQKLARNSVQSYDLILFLNHVFPPAADGVRLSEHLSEKECVEINREIESYLRSERVPYLSIDSRDATSTELALKEIQSRHKVHV